MRRIIISFLILLTISSCLLFQGCNNLDYSNKELSAEEIYEFASPSVVEITGKMKSGTSTGTGFFYDQNGTVITNYHVIKGCIDATITLANGISYNVDKVIGYDEDRDIAILSTFCASSIPLEICDTEIATGEKVYAIGSSLGLSGSLSDGIISSAKRIINGNIYIQTTAPISHGNSGGPLLDCRGKVVGITTAFLTDGQNLNLAIPIEEIKNISTNKSISLEELYMLYVKSNPSDAFGITSEQYKIVTMISNDPLGYCEHIVELKSILSNDTYDYEVQLDQVVEYLNNISLEYGQKIIMYKMLFMQDTEYNKDIVDYLNGRDDINYAQMKAILEGLGMTVDSEGYIYWD